jgi:hypothetical protein
MQRIWGIGLTRTGTTSLNTALNILGYRSIHWPTTSDLLHGNLQAATDESVAVVYKYLDFRHPGSKFILTERDEESWVRSTAAHRKIMATNFARKVAEWHGPAIDGAGFAETVRRFSHQLDRDYAEQERNVELILTQTWLYEAVEFDEEKFRAGFRRYHADVERYFAQRPGDLLRIRICDGEGWEKLAPFVGRPIPEQPFPNEHAIVSKRQQ